MGCVGARSTVPGTGCGGAIDDSLYSPFFSVASDDRDDDDKDGRAPQTVNEALAHGDAHETVEDKGSSPSSISAGSAEGGDVDSSPPSSASFMKSAELDPSARWSERS